MSKATKVLVVDQYAVQKLSQQENRQESKPKTTKQKQAKNTQPQQNQNKNDTEKWDRHQQWELHDDILCVIMRMAQNKKQNRGTTKHTNGPCWWVREATKLHAETRDPPSQDPRDHKEQPFRHDIHPDTSKQTPTTPGRNESGEKRENGETGG